VTALTPGGPNAEQIRYWNETAGPKWVALHDTINRQILPLGELAMDLAAVKSGDHILDVGCGCGVTTIELARRCAPHGTATGVDLSAVMLERARDTARDAGVTNARFENADAQTHSFQPAALDVLFSRFGVMFFADPPAAFSNLHRALKGGGRLAFVCWRSLQENPWMLVPLMAAAQHVSLPAPPAPGAPGPFAFADSERVRAILTAAGFRDIGLEPVTTTLCIGGSSKIEETVDFLMQMGPAAAALREADPAVQPTVAAAIGAALLPYYVEGVGVRMEGAAWIVTARA
jgi:SAM-dependent methyltransferase